LKGMTLKTLRIGRCLNVEDLSPLAGMPLEDLNLVATHVADLSPLKGAPLRILYMSASLVSDLSPLEGMPLEMFSCGSKEAPIVDIGPLRRCRCAAPASPTRWR